MEVYILTLFSSFIIYRSVHTLMKLFKIAYKRNELSKRKYRSAVSISFLIGVTVASIVPIIFKALFT
ncbi:hypothetical protein U9J35_03255 [Rossellomorea aquimaris]|nr:hypothetical protein [Rossellomorea aquimaris]WRP07197.1 hypothetical protein U9J35_03255 [Rossellomorea aquimaris]